MRSATPEFPIYIVSKGRWASRMTMRALDAMHVPYSVVVEAHELDAYAAVIDRARLLVLDPAFKRDYDACDDLGDSKSKGPGPARNFAWEHSRAAGHARHWVVDDNIAKFQRLNHNLKIPVGDGAIFRCMEDFAERYANVAIAGPNYEFFAKRKQKLPPFIINTRIYSCLLIRNDLPLRWRARYNEDTDLALRVLKAGWCTVQFNAFLQDKAGTQTVKGGNTREFYAHEGTLPKSQMLVSLHPDVAQLVWKFGRWHHRVDYSPFRINQLIRRPEFVPRPGVDDYGMRLRHLTEAQPFRYGDALPADFELPPSFKWVLRKDLGAGNPFDRITVRANDRVMDCGSAVGTFAAAAAEAGARVRCYEPVPANAEVLARNMARYGARASIVQAALVAGNDTTVDLCGSGFPGTHSIVQRDKAKGRAVTAAARCFRTELLEFAPDMIKLDVEGAEYELLATLQPGDLRSVSCMFIEFHPHAERAQRVEAITAYLAAEGLTVIKQQLRAFTAVRTAQQQMVA